MHLIKEHVLNAGNVIISHHESINLNLCVILYFRKTVAMKHDPEITSTLAVYTVASFPESDTQL